MYLWRRFNFDTSSLRPAKRLNVYLLLFSAPGLFFRQRQVNIYLGGGERGRALENVMDHVVFRVNEGIFFVY